MPTGLFVIGSRSGTRANLMTANLVVQVATGPKLVAASIETGSVTAGLVEAGGTFTVSILDRADRALVRRFVKPVAEVVTDSSGALVSMAGVEVAQAPSGNPVLAGALCWVDCEVRHHLPAGSHRVFVGEVMAVGARGGAMPDDPEVLRMEDTRMYYGG
jgi:flavin reductase (DIM6/NTAB) family NADH-FMN oxidoreductase RutF